MNKTFRPAYVIKGRLIAQARLPSGVPSSPFGPREGRGAARYERFTSICVCVVHVYIYVYIYIYVFLGFSILLVPIIRARVLGLLVVSGKS